jgi:class 3 adenylate cyclase/PAS domain-containing protein
MAKQNSKVASTIPSALDEVVPLLRAGLDALSFGFAVFDKDLKLVASNRAFRELRSYPTALCQPGTEMAELYRFNAERGDYGPGDIEAHVKSRLTRALQFRSHELEYELATGRTLSIRYTPIAGTGLLLSYADITDRKLSEEELARKEAQLRVALDNMPCGMLMFDKEKRVIVFNEQHRELLDLPEGLREVGKSFRDQLRYQAERGDFGEGDVDELVEQAMGRLAGGEPTRYERRLFTGRIVEVSLAQTPDGGVVLVFNDITERKRAEEASEEANKLVAEKNRMLESLSNQLSKYLSPQVYASIFTGEQSVEIASKRKKLTVFFSDIADFTGTTDSLESEELTNLLNHYLTEMSKIALDHGATIDKYVGDAIIAFFGDPETRGVKEDARTCVTMAIGMQRRMRELQSEWLDMGLERPFRVRMGINTGFCTVGNFGSGDRMDYTIIGNEVNLAARLESHAEVGGILMAHETYSLVKDTVLAEEGDALTVKGFAKPVRTYKVAGIYDDLVEQGKIFRKEEEGIRILVDLDKRDRADAIQAIEDILSQLKG